jgi:hypothetical protein
MKRFGFAAVLLTFVLVGARDASASSIYFNDFETNTNGWNVFGGGLDATQVPSGTNGITSAGGSFHAVNSATGSAGNWGGYNFGAGNAVPTVFQPYTTSLDIYLDVNGGFANDTRFDFDSAINNAAGTFLRDFIFNCGFYNESRAGEAERAASCAARATTRSLGAHLRRILAGIRSRSVPVGGTPSDQLLRQRWVPIRGSLSCGGQLPRRRLTLGGGCHLGGRQSIRLV